MSNPKDLHREPGRGFVIDPAEARPGHPAVPLRPSRFKEDVPLADGPSAPARPDARTAASRYLDS